MKEYGLHSLQSSVFSVKWYKLWEVVNLRLCLWRASFIWYMMRFQSLLGRSLSCAVLCLVAKLCLTVCDAMVCSTPGFPVFQHLPEFAQTHVHWVSDAFQPSGPLSSPSPPAFNVYKPRHLRLMILYFYTFSLNKGLWLSKLSMLISIRIFDSNIVFLL